MSEVYAAAAQLQGYLDQRGWRNCIIGGVAVIAWGRQRTTVDADFTLLTGFGSEREYLEQLSKQYPGRWPDEINFATSARCIVALHLMALQPISVWRHSLTKRRSFPGRGHTHSTLVTSFASANSMI